MIGELEALVAAEPLREHLHAQRMLALYRSGRQSEALEAYRDARSALVEQIGVEPGAELRRLQDAILAQDPALDVPEAAEAEPVTSPRPPPRRPSMRVLVAAAVLVVAGLTAFGVIRVLEPDGLAGIDENSVGLIDPDSGLHHRAVRGRQEPERGRRRRRIRLDRQRGRRDRHADRPRARRRP